MGEAVAPPRPVTPAGILAARLAELCDRAEAKTGMAPELVSGLREAHELAAGLEPYLQASTSPQSPDLERLAALTHEQDWANFGSDIPLEQEMLSGEVEGQLLRMLVRITGARRVLELGMFTGYSALAMAEALGEDGTVLACELDPEVAAFARNCFDGSAAGHKISVCVGPALATLDRLAATGQSFDLVFIDADKAGYVDYFVALLDAGLLAPGGLICADNTLMQGQPYTSVDNTANGDAIARFNLAVAADTRVEQVIVPMRDGLTLIRRVTDPGGTIPADA